MRRALFLISLVAVLPTGLGLSSTAAAEGPGHNLATKRLEGAYKFALQDRRFDPQGCYAPPGELAKILTDATGRKVGVARNTKRLRTLNQVYVLKDGSNCNQLRMALRARSEEHTSELQSLTNLVCRLLLEKKNNKKPNITLTDIKNQHSHN